MKIEIGKGVCGTSAKFLQTVVVDDVHKFEGHIACDANSNSEIVIPIIVEGELIGVLDIDSPLLNRFLDNDKENIEALLTILIKHTDFTKTKIAYEV